MISIDKCYEGELIINKSKFYSFVYPVISEDDAREKLNNIKEKFHDATHVCSAYTLTSPRVDKADDDGEPSGTAGKPLLELIKKKGLDNILLVVVRYFGGIKLGAGGLVRAYTNSGNVVLDEVKQIEVESVGVYRVTISLDKGSRLLESIRSMAYEVVSCVYTDCVTIEFVGDICEDLKRLYPIITVEKIGGKTICLK